jgi:hypothetical protein
VISKAKAAACLSVQKCFTMASANLPTSDGFGLADDKLQCHGAADQRLNDFLTEDHKNSPLSFLAKDRFQGTSCLLGTHGAFARTSSTKKHHDAMATVAIGIDADNWGSILKGRFKKVEFHKLATNVEKSTMTGAICLEIDTGLKDDMTTKPNKNQPTSSSLALRFQTTKKHPTGEAKKRESSFNELIQTKPGKKAQEKQTHMGGLGGFLP